MSAARRPRPDRQIAANVFNTTRSPASFNALIRGGAPAVGAASGCAKCEPLVTHSRMSAPRGEPSEITERHQLPDNSFQDERDGSGLGGHDEMKSTTTGPDQ